MKSLGKLSITHMVPASGVIALFDLSEDEVETVEVLCWALVINESGSKITGMVLDSERKKLVPVEERGGFINYESLEEVMIESDDEGGSLN